MKLRRESKFARPEFLEWAWRAGALGLLILNLYIKGNYVSQETYAQDKTKFDETIQTLVETVNKIEIENKVNDRQDSELLDHEQRLRALEKKR